MIKFIFLFGKLTLGFTAIIAVFNYAVQYMDNLAGQASDPVKCLLVLIGFCLIIGFLSYVLADRDRNARG